MGAGLVLLASLWLPWFLTQDGNPNSRVSGTRSQRFDITPFVAYDIFVWVLLAVCIVPFILALIVMRGQQLSWDRGEVTAIVGMASAVLILFNGLIGGKPDDCVECTLGPGWYIGLIASLAIFIAGVARMGEKGVTNKPPGV
jgi:hypothetical protein